MTRLIVALLLISAQALAFGGKAPAPLPSPSSAPAIPAGPLRIAYDPVTYYSTPAQRVKVASAAKAVNAVLHSQCFSDFMQQTWADPSGKPRQLANTGGRTPKQVVEHIQTAQGTVPVKFYYSRWSSAVAYRSPPSPEININTKYLGDWSADCEIGATMAHEMLHALLEYDHSYKWTVEREYSVNYKVGGAAKIYGGDAFMACCKKLGFQ